MHLLIDAMSVSDTGPYTSRVVRMRSNVGALANLGFMAQAYVR
jgi:hypothetical protein